MPDPQRTHPIVRDIADLDKRILRLLAERGRIMARAKTLAPIQDIEKALWKEWERAAAGQSPDPGLWRRLFTLMGEVKLRAESEEGRPGFALTPRREPVKVALPGPRSVRQTKLFAALATLAGTPVKLGGILRNDPLADLVKGLDQVGAGLYFEGDDLCARQRERDLDFVDKVVFVGDDLINFHIMACLALATPGRTKFTGGSRLKLADLRHAATLYPMLGARLTSVVPRSHGLPARFEASAVFQDEVHLPSELPLDAAVTVATLAPAVAAQSGLRTMRLTWDVDAPFASALADAAYVLEQCGFTVDLGARAMDVSGSLEVPETPALTLDPDLSAVLLALPRFLGGDVRLDGPWPEHLDAADAVPSLLRATGLNLSLGKSSARSTRAERAEPGTLNFNRRPGLEPLAAALGAAVLHKAPLSASVVLAHAQDSACEEFADRMGLACERTDDGIVLSPGSQASRAPEPGTVPPWAAPSPAWAMAYSLAGLLRFGLALDNPGVVTEVMPGYWGLYNSLPAPAAQWTHPDTRKKEVTKPDDDTSKRKTGRRIKL